MLIIIEFWIEEYGELPNISIKLIIYKITLLVTVDAYNLCEKACMLYLVSHRINYNYTHAPSL